MVPLVNPRKRIIEALCGSMLQTVFCGPLVSCEIRLTDLEQSDRNQNGKGNLRAHGAGNTY